MNLSPHFSLDELTHSDTAKREGIPNRPDAAGTTALGALCSAILEPLRAAVGGAIKVNSGYRGPQLNARIGGAGKSQHLVGEAADIQAPSVSVLQLFKTILRLGLPFDQVIYEAKNASTMWVHVSHRAAGNRGEIRIAQFNAAGKPTGYPIVTVEQALALPEPARSRSMGPAALPGYVEGDDEPVTPARARKAAPKKAAVKNTAPKKAAVKKSSAAKVPARKAVAKKTAAKKAPAKKAAAK
jgi:zinc D-Ala-D-Ala carboxypeptidase